MSEIAGRPARVRRAVPIANGLAALVISACLLVLLGHGHGAGSGPALGSLLVPGHGGWTFQFLLTHSRPPGMLP
jgi:hypothetical protein